jgi:uncharacterized protein YggE
MRRLSSCGPGLVLVAQLAAAGAATAQSDKPEIRTSASATRSVRADQASLTLTFTAEDSTPALAAGRVALRADSVRNALTALGIPRDSLITASRWSWGSDRIQPFTRNRCLVPALPGHPCRLATDTLYANGRIYSTQSLVDTLYRARETIDVHAGDPTLVGAVIDSALARRITEISNIRFEASDVHDARLAALQEAASRAREQAEAIATANGGRLGKVISLSTSGDEDRYAGIRVEGTFSTASGATQVTAPLVPVTVTVYGRWEFVAR